MIKINKLEFSNVFSFGQDNVICFDENIVTQLIGNNGTGKSSIPTILEEALYNKNSRGIKKADIKNRNTDIQEYSINVYFSVDADKFILQKVVKSTAKVKLFKNGIDISGHTATQTYKKLETEIFKLDFNTFSKLVNQSMVSSLDVLTATDTNRKNFLISLFSFESYLAAEACVKEAHKETKTILAGLESSVNTMKDWISKHGNISDKLEEKVEPEYDNTLDSELINFKTEKLNINSINAERKANILAKQELDSLISKKPEEVTEDVSDLLKVTTSNKNIKLGEINSAKTKVSKFGAVKDKCPTCGQNLDIGNTKILLEEAKKELEDLTKELEPIEKELTVLTRLNSKYKTYETWLKRKDILESKYDSTKPTILLETAELDSKINKLNSEISSLKASIVEIQKHNNNVKVHNALVDSNIEKLKQYNEDLVLAESELESVSELNTDLNILVAALGTKGLIQYKIESMIKVFEELINNYLAIFSSGAFVISFVIEDSKLCLNLYDNSKLIDIKSLSSGEFTMVNTATLLAVRKMLSAISKVNINLVILDEVISVLDEDAKEILVSILLNEKELNSILVSHGYRHPLAEVIKIEKEDKISCIIY